MTLLSTELLNVLVKKQKINEGFRFSLEPAVTNLIQVELSIFLGIKKDIILEGHLFKKIGNQVRHSSFKHS